MTKLHSAIVACTVVSVLGVAPLGAQAPRAEAAARRAAAQTVPIGATVNVRLSDGQRFKAVLFGVDEEGVTVKPATRVPVASMRIPFDRLDGMERDDNAIHFGRYIGVGAAIGGAVLVVLLNGLTGRH